MDIKRGDDEFTDEENGGGGQKDLYHTGLNARASSHT